MDKGFAADVEKLIEADRRSEFRQEVETTTRTFVDSKIAFLKGRRCLTCQITQVEELRTFIRETRLSFPQRAFLKEFLTEAQNESWRQQEEAQRRQMEQSVAKVHTVGANGKPVVKEVRPTALRERARFRPIPGEIQ